MDGVSSESSESPTLGEYGIVAVCWATLGSGGNVLKMWRLDLS